MTLYEHDEKGLMALFYHNPYARIPINPKIIAAANCNQYKINLEEVKWELIDCTV
jgi:hypothetical protein